MFAGVRNILEPINDPITIIIADVSPKGRDKSEEVSAVPLIEVDAVIISDCFIEEKTGAEDSLKEKRKFEMNELIRRR